MEAINFLEPWNVVWFSLAALLIVGFACAALVASKVLRFLLRRAEKPTEEWFAEFDLERYRTLEQLFAPHDFEFLRRQPGYSPDLASRLKADRVKIAESYLRQLEADVRLLLNFANHAASRAVKDMNGLSAFLLKQELQFIISITRLRFELAMIKVGFPRRIRFERLLDSLGAMLQQSRALAIQL